MNPVQVRPAEAASTADQPSPCSRETLCCAEQTTAGVLPAGRDRGIKRTNGTAGGSATEGRGGREGRGGADKGRDEHGAVHGDA